MKPATDRVSALDLVEEDDVPGMLTRAHAVVLGTGAAGRQIRQLVVVRGEEGTAADDVVEVRDRAARAKGVRSRRKAQT